MSKRKIIMHNETDLDDVTVLRYILKVCEEGEISETGNGKQYCLATVFKSGIAVECQKRKNTYTFKVLRKDVEYK